MSSILFDPATAAGGNAGPRTAPIPSGYSPGGVSFDALLAKSQSKHDAEAAYGVDRYKDDRDYDTGRDDKAERIADDDIDRDSDVGTDWDDTRSEDWNDDDNSFDDTATQEAHRDTSDAQDRDQGGNGDEIAAAEGQSRTETQQDDSGEDGVAAAAATGATTAGRDASGAAAAASQAVASSRKETQSAQSQSATAQNQQNTGQTAGKGNQPTNTTVNLINNNLHSQSNTALTSGSAVIALQSVDPKTGDPAGRPLTFDVLANAQTSDASETAANVNNGKTAAQLAKLRQAEAAQTAGNQAVGNAAQNAQSSVAAVTQQTASTAATTTGSETAGGTVSSTTAAGSGTPSFTSLAPVGGVTQTANATGAGAAASGNAASGAATPSEQVAVEIHKGIAAGKDSITIRLNPAELGKIDVKMELSDDGTLRAVIAVDRPETLDLLQKDIRGLERALQNAGLQADSGSLNFSLRGDGDNQAGGFETASGSGGNANASGEEGSADDPLANAGQANRSSHDGALDISV